ncbi:MAG: hypothetical protein RIB32_02120 [Phycisphaerales bacterium]
MRRTASAMLALTALGGCKICTHEDVVVQVVDSRTGEPATGVWVRAVNYDPTIDIIKLNCTRPGRIPWAQTDEHGIARARLERNRIQGGVGLRNSEPREHDWGQWFHYLEALPDDTPTLHEYLEPWPDGSPVTLSDLSPIEQRWGREHVESKRGERRLPYEVLMWRE